MALSVQSPGVYVQEVPSASAPIAGVSTSTAGFIGLVDDAVKMPPKPGEFEKKADGTLKLDSGGNPKPVPYTIVEAGSPQLVSSWVEFKTLFGDREEKNRILAEAVFGFFNNGGARCWVTRVTSLADKSGTPEVDQVDEALTAFRDIDDLSILAIPMPSNMGMRTATETDRKRRVAIRGKLIDHCEAMSDRVAILDGEEMPADRTAKAVYPNVSKSGMGQTSENGYAAVYYPWLDVGATNAAGETVHVPPSGHIAGVYARVDAERGVFKAPANESIRGVIGVKDRLSRADQAGLNPQGINVIRQFNGDIKVWGARTIGGDANGEWKYINVRRLFIFLAESIDAGTRWAVFEPNDAGLWAKITRNITAFLTTVWRSGALFGSTPEEAFFVQCDASTNPPENRDLGQVTTEVGVSIVRPAEFVIFEVQQWSGPESS